MYTSNKNKFYLKHFGILKFFAVVIFSIVNLYETEDRSRSVPLKKQSILIPTLKIIAIVFRESTNGSRL